MKKSIIYRVLLCSFLVFMVYSCSEDNTDILSGLKDLPTPVISNMTDAEGFGGAEATITGTGFSTDPEKNLITFGPSSKFGYKSIRPTAATETSLTFTKPVISAVGDTIFTEVRVSRIDDADPVRSNALPVSFLPLISVYAEGFTRARSIAFDAAGNGYVADYDPDNLRIVKVTASGQEDYAHFPATNLRGEIEFDSQGNLWVSTAWEALYKITPGGGDPEDTGLTGDDAGRYFKSISFDANDNLYGALENIYRVAPDGTVTDLVEIGWPGAVSTVADGYLYWWTKSEEDAGILQKAPLTAGGIGEIETILEAENGKYWPSSIVVDTDGNVYGTGGANWGSDNPTNIYKFEPDGTESLVYELGVGCWGLEFHGGYIYVATQEDGRILKCYMTGAVGAGR